MKTNAQPTKKIGRLTAGKKIISSSWKILKLEPGLIAVEVIAGIITILLAVLLLAGALLIGEYNAVDQSRSFTLGGPKYWALLVVFYVIAGAVYAFFTGWFSHIVYERLEGNNPTVLGSLRATMSKIAPLSVFGVINGLMNFIFEAIRNRTSFLGDLVSFVGQMAWSVASIFAVPIIVNRKEKIGPIAAVKESTKLIKKTWGEGVTSQFGIALVGMLIISGYMLLFGTAASLFFILGTGPGIVAVVLSIMGVIVIGIVLSLISSIANTALYYYAETGKSPAEFDKELMRSAMTPKKARKIFG